METQANQNAFYSTHHSINWTFCFQNVCLYFQGVSRASHGNGEITHTCYDPAL